MSGSPRRARSFRLPRLRIARAFGIPIELDASWFVVFALVVAALSLAYYPTEYPGRAQWVDILDGVLTAAGFFGSIVIHELAHSLVARREGMDVEKVTLFIFGGVASLTGEPENPFSEVRMAAAGPAMSVALSLVCFGGYAASLALGLPDAVWAPLRYLADVNLLVAAFNLLPGFPMDGGRVVRATLWWATGDRALASRIAGLGGRVVGFGLTAVGVLGALSFGPGTLWLAALGLFIERLAAATSRTMSTRLRLSALSAGELSDLDGRALPASTRLSAVRESRGSTGARTVWPVADEGRLSGMLVLDEVGPDEMAADEAVGALARDDVARWLVDATDSAETALRRLSGGAPCVGVVSAGRLVGLISPKALQAAMNPPVTSR